MGTMKTLHIVGFKNSGKTTLIARWVRLIKAQGLTVAVLKHHGHHVPLDMPDSETDAMQFFESGAEVSVVAGAGAVQLMMNSQPDFRRMKEIAALENPAVLLIEGYKEENGEKVLLLRNEQDWIDLHHLSTISVVVGDLSIEQEAQQFTSRTANELDNWFIDWVKENDDETI